MSKPDLVKQPTAAPSRKVFFGAVAGVATIAVQNTIVKLADKSEWLDWLGDDIVMTALPTLVGFGVAYLMRERKA